MRDFRDYYKILEIAPTASFQEIRASYRRLARKFHPDVSTSRDAEARMKLINEAYAVLHDPEKRAFYDFLYCLRQAELSRQAAVRWSGAEQASKMQGERSHQARTQPHMQDRPVEEETKPDFERAGAGLGAPFAFEGAWVMAIPLMIPLAIAVWGMEDPAENFMLLLLAGGLALYLFDRLTHLLHQFRGRKGRS